MKPLDGDGERNSERENPRRRAITKIPGDEGDEGASEGRTTPETRSGREQEEAEGRREEEEKKEKRRKKRTRRKT